MRPLISLCLLALCATPALADTPTTKALVSPTKLAGATRGVVVAKPRLGKHGQVDVACAVKDRKLSCAAFKAKKRVAGIDLAGTRTTGIVFDCGDGVSHIIDFGKALPDLQTAPPAYIEEVWTDMRPGGVR